MSDVVGVSMTVAGVEPVHGRGTLVGLAIVELNLSGVEMVLQGVQVRRSADGRVTVNAPLFKHPRDGMSCPAVLMPVDLTNAIAAAVCDVVSNRS